MPDDFAASMVAEPVNVEANALILKLVASRLPLDGGKGTDTLIPGSVSTPPPPHFNLCVRDDLVDAHVVDRHRLAHARAHVLCRRRSCLFSLEDNNRMAPAGAVFHPDTRNEAGHLRNRGNDTLTQLALGLLNIGYGDVHDHRMHVGFASVRGLGDPLATADPTTTVSVAEPFPGPMSLFFASEQAPRFARAFA